MFGTSPFAPADFEASSTMCTRCFETQSSPGCTCTRKFKFLTHSLISVRIFIKLVLTIPQNSCRFFPLFQVGTQIDLRDDAATIDKLAKNKQKPLSLEAGEKLAKELRAVKYVECSALTQVSV